MNDQVASSRMLGVSEDDFLKAFWGCGWESDPLAFEFVLSFTRMPDFLKAIQKPTFELGVSYIDEDGKKANAYLRPKDLMKAFSDCLDRGCWHCGEPVSLDLDDWDACVGTMILQVALYGEEIYG
jgi:hypothetical protein